MNILTDVLPETLTILDTEYLVDSDFRACLKIILAFEDSELTPQEKQVVLLSMLFVTPPPNTQETYERAMWFLNGGQETEDSDNPMRLYSFAKDSNFIFAAFRQTHGIDLQTISLHWWEFLALFMDLGSETFFCHLTAIRKRLLTGTATKEDKELRNKMPHLFDLPQVDTRTLEEKEMEQEFFRKVEEARARRNNQ